MARFPKHSLLWTSNLVKQLAKRTSIGTALPKLGMTLHTATCYFVFLSRSGNENEMLPSLISGEFTLGILLVSHLACICCNNHNDCTDCLEISPLLKRLLLVIVGIKVHYIDHCLAVKHSNRESHAHFLTNAYLVFMHSGFISTQSTMPPGWPQLTTNQSLFVYARNQCWLFHVVPSVQPGTQKWREGDVRIMSGTLHLVTMGQGFNHQ